MPKVKVDGIEIEVPQGATVLQACEVAGKEIPRFCYHERLSIAGNCRMCLVEVKPGPPKPQASCALPAADGQEISTMSPLVKKAREGVMEFLLINHPLDCPICDQGGECDLQDQAMAYGRGHSRFAENKRAVTEKYMGPVVKTIMTRCIQCTRCVRFAEEVAGVEEIGAIGRGENMEITSYLEGAVTSELSGNVVDLCPVGALVSKPYSFEARPWELRKVPGIDVMDGVGTNIRIDHRFREVMRALPRLNEDVNEEWAHDKTRHAVDGLVRNRLDRPWVRRDGKLTPATWDEAFAVIAERLEGAAGDEVAAIAGDLQDVESVFALKKLLEAFGSSLHECRQDGARFDVSSPAAYRFNATIAGIESAPAILLIGTNPRWEAPLVNTRIRKAVKAGARVFRVGPAVDLTYPVDELGNDLAILGKLPKEAREAFEGKAGAAVIVGMGALATEGAYESARAAAAALGASFGLLHTAASRVRSARSRLRRRRRRRLRPSPCRRPQGAVPARRRRNGYVRLRRHLHNLYRHPRRPRSPPCRRHPARRGLYREARYLRQSRGAGSALRIRRPSARGSARGLDHLAGAVRRARQDAAVRHSLAAARRHRGRGSAARRSRTEPGRSAPRLHRRGAWRQRRDRLSDRGFLPDQSDRPIVADAPALLGRTAPRAKLPGGGGMSGLPGIVQRAPALFYGAAVLFFVASVALNYLELQVSMEYVNGSNPIVRIARLRALYQGALESLYIAANGVLAQILLAIWRDGGFRRERGGEA